MATWEPPVPVQLLVSSRRVAAELDMPQWKADELCWALGKYYYTEGRGAYRVTRRSLEAYKRLRSMELTHIEARSALRSYMVREELPPIDFDLDEARARAWTQMRRGWSIY